MVAPKYFTNVGAQESNKINSEVDKLEIIHFHSTSQCYSCITMGQLTEDTLNTYFQKELNSGKITFEHINVDLPENSEKVKKYGATGSSLLIGTYYEDGTFSKVQNTNVWYKINDKEAYMEYFKSVVENKLSGN
jgi:hypothetical protein